MIFTKNFKIQFLTRIGYNIILGEFNGRPLYAVLDSKMNSVYSPQGVKCLEIYDWVDRAFEILFTKFMEQNILELAKSWKVK
jgi:hypothetical protein